MAAAELMSSRRKAPAFRWSVSAPGICAGAPARALVEQALRLGYRHVDTAEMYDNEREVGEGLRASGVPRDEVFVTTKVWPSHFAPRELERAAKESLVRLRLSEVDLLLLHWPNPQIPLSETLGALCKVKRKGLARHIGVSNFTVALIEEAVRLADEPLVCNQIEMHPFLDQSKVVAACRQHGMAVVAYSPIARGGVKNDKARASAAPSARSTARPRRRCACASWCSRASSSSRAPAGSSGWRRISRSSTSSCPKPR